MFYRVKTFDFYCNAQGLIHHKLYEAINTFSNKNNTNIHFHIHALPTTTFLPPPSPQRHSPQTPSAAPLILPTISKIQIESFRIDRRRVCVPSPLFPSASLSLSISRVRASRLFLPVSRKTTTTMTTTRRHSALEEKAKERRAEEKERESQHLRIVKSSAQWESIHARQLQLALRARSR